MSKVHSSDKPQFTQLLDYYLSDEGKHYLPEINRLAKANNDDADDKILHYAMEGIRLNGTFGSYRQATTSMTVDDGGRPVSVKAGDKVFCSFVSPGTMTVLIYAGANH